MDQRILRMNDTMREREVAARRFWAEILPEREPAPLPAVTLAVRELNEVIASIDPVLTAWRNANPAARFPHWWKVLYDFCSSCPDRAWCACGLFVQTSSTTDTIQLLKLARAAVRMAACNHEHGAWSGSVNAVYGEYDDNLIFICPDCGYKGA